IERFRRRHAVGANIAGLALDLLFDAGDANLEKFIEIIAEDGHELDPLDQRLRRVLRFLQNAPVKFQPTQLAINEIGGIRKIAFRLDRLWQERQLIRRHFGSRSLHLNLSIQLRAVAIFARVDAMQGELSLAAGQWAGGSSSPLLNIKTRRRSRIISIARRSGRSTLSARSDSVAERTDRLMPAWRRPAGVGCLRLRRRKRRPRQY